MKKLLTPITIGSLTVKNRLVMPPMATSKATEGKVTNDLCTYYDEKTKGGYLGLLIAEHTYISLTGQASANQASISEDSDIEGLSKLVKTIHNNGTPVFAQLNHAGSKAIAATTLSASAIMHPTAKANDVLPQEMTQADIDNVIQEFVSAAKRAKEAGFDGVQIHGAHGYLLSQFYSPITNKRTDGYGGTLENRIKFHIEVIKAVRKAVGKEYPISIRFGASDFLAGSSTIEEAVMAAVAFEEAGVDLLDISGGLKGYIRPGHKEEGFYKDITVVIKEKVSIPVILTGGIVSYEVPEQLLEEGCADLIGVGRAIFKDSNWAKQCIENNE